MVCVEVRLDGALFRKAGIKDASLITPILSGFVGDETPARLSLSGMCDLPVARAAHVYWGPDQLELKTGTEVAFRFTTCGSPTPPERIVPTDSAAYIDEQRDFEAYKKSFVPDTSRSPRNFPELAFHCRVNGKAATVATLNPSDEHLLCSLCWDKWHPDRVFVSVRSFGKEHSGKTEWLREHLALGDELAIRVVA